MPKPKKPVITNKEEALQHYYKYFDTKSVDKQHLVSQLLHNLFIMPTKEKGRSMPHFQASKPGEVYHADLVYLPNDDGYKYALVVVDTTSKVADAEPLKNKQASTIKEAFQTIFKRKILPMPEYQISVDDGSEFKGITAKYFNENGVYIKISKPGRSRQVALAENRNKLIAVRLFLRQYAQEMLTDKPSTEWVEDLPIILEQMNKQFKDQYEASLKKKHKDTKPYFLHNEVLQVGQRVRVALDKPKDYLPESKLSGNFRASDPRWETKIRTIENIIINDGQPVMYVVSGLPSVEYTLNRLQLVPEKEDLPPQSTRRDNKEIKKKTEVQPRYNLRTR